MIAVIHLDKDGQINSYEIVKKMKKRRKAFSIYAKITNQIYFLLKWFSSFIISRDLFLSLIVIDFSF